MGLTAPVAPETQSGKPEAPKPDEGKGDLRGSTNKPNVKPDFSAVSILPPDSSKLTFPTDTTLSSDALRDIKKKE